MEIVVEEEPSPELLKELVVGERALLFGLYQGVPRPEKSYFQGVSLPNRITLFRPPSFVPAAPNRTLKTRSERP